MKKIVILLFIAFISCKDNSKKSIKKPVRIVNDTTIGFSNMFNEFSIEELNDLSQNQCESIKNISIGHFDSIPMAFQKFSNVEKLSIGSDWADVFIPDIFPKLKKIELEMASIIIDKNARFKKNLLEIEAGKSTIKNIKSFAELPNLNILNLGFSAFDTFPKNLDTLEYLEQLHLGAYNGKLDITDLNFSKIKSLKSIILVSGYYDTLLIGFPRDISRINNNVALEISHILLTQEQKKVLKRFKKPKY